MAQSKKTLKPAAPRKAPKGKAKKLPAPRASSPRVTPFLMFEKDCAEAAAFYVSIFKDSKVIRADAMSATFTLDGRPFQAFNGGSHFKFSDAISLFVHCEDQEEVDFYWDRLLAGGGAPGRCGWLVDRFGVSWQVIPKALGECLGHKDRAKAQRATQAMMGMRKIDVRALVDAVNG